MDVRQVVTEPAETPNSGLCGQASESRGSVQFRDDLEHYQLQKTTLLSSQTCHLTSGVPNSK